MKRISIIILVIATLISCQERRLRREKTKLANKNYTEYKSMDNCVEEISFGQIYVEFQNTSRKMILQKLKLFNDSIFGVQTDTMLYHTYGAPWTVAYSWISQELFVDFHNNHYGYTVFPHKNGLESNIIQHGNGNTASRFEDFEDISFNYMFSICPRQKLKSKYAEYGISIRRSLLTQDELDSVYSSSFNRIHPSSSTQWIRYGIEEYVADITISLEMRDGDNEKEFYYMPMTDTIRVYNYGPKK